jgi:hypothetical protein
LPLQSAEKGARFKPPGRICSRHILPHQALEYFGTIGSAGSVEDVSGFLSPAKSGRGLGTWQKTP